MLWRRSVLVLSVLIGALGLSLLGAQLVAPDTVERIAGETKVALQQVTQQVVAPAALPTVRLGPLGGLTEMNWCDGSFIEMASYQLPGIPPVYAAHNNCGGDIILSWQLGDHVKVEGSDVLYQVVEERHTAKWAQVESLVGMKGTLVLQTCYYGQNVMRFLALAPVS